MPGQSCNGFRFAAAMCGALAATSLASDPAGAVLAISSGATKNVACSAGICTATKLHAVLNAADLVSMLASSDITVKSGNKAQDVELRASLSWTGASRLTLDAFRSITLRSPLTVAGPGALTLTTNDGGTGGDVLFAGKGHARFWDLSSSLVINGSGYILLADTGGLASNLGGNSSGHFALANSYDAGVDGTYSAAPISGTFGGTLEGLGNTISNLSIDVPGNGIFVGLFAQLGAGSAVRDIGLIEVAVIASKSSDVGGLAGTNDGSITHSFVTGSVRGRLYVGGLTGWNFASILASHTAGRVQGGAAGSQIGGLVGLNDGSIANSHSTARVSGRNSAEVGGLAGRSYAVTNSWASGEVSGFSRASVGGLIGHAYIGFDRPFANCFATGAVSGGGDAVVGGLIGYGDNYGSPELMNAYAAGPVSGGYGSTIGGLIGFLNQGGNMVDAYWDMTTSGVGDSSQGVGNISNAPGITGLTDEQLRSGLLPGFDPSIWAEDASVNSGLPYLIADPPP